MDTVLIYTKSFERFVPFMRIGNYRLKELKSESPLSTFAHVNSDSSFVNPTGSYKPLCRAELVDRGLYEFIVLS